MTSLSIPVVSVNVRSNPIQLFRNVRARIDQASKILSAHSIVVGQEVDPEKKTLGKIRRSYAVIWRNQMAEQGKASYAVNSTPVSWPKAEYTEISAADIFVHTFRARVTPTRRYSRVRLRHNVTGKTVTMIAVWPISGWYKRGVTFKAWRIARWADYHRKLVQEVAAELRLGTNVVIVAGDWNHPNPPPVHPDEVALSDGRLDHIVAVAGTGYRVKAGGHGKTGLAAGMDHPMIYGTALLTEVPR